MPTRKCALIGHGIQHSLSPKIHRAFAEQFRVDLQYDYIEVTAQGLPEILKRDDLFGLNVTTPYKLSVIPHCVSLTDRAHYAGAVNTLVRVEGGWQGDNTDGIGWIRDVTMNLHIPIADKKILILGAGGAVRGVLRPLLSLGPRKIVIANRTPEKASALAQYFKTWGKVAAIPLHRLAYKSFDFIIQASCAGQTEQALTLPETFSVENSICYDLNYGVAAQTFLRWAYASGAARLASGLGMLVEQAAESFWRWHRIKPNTEVVIADLRREYSTHLHNYDVLER